MIFTVKLADKFIQIDSKSAELHDFFKDYLVKAQDFDIPITYAEEEILSENDFFSGIEYPRSYLETLTVLRKIAEIFPLHNRFLIHGASIAFGDKGYLFTAPSGTGKSTHIRLWRKYLGENVKIINGDKPFISIENSEPRIYGTPWAGKENWHKNRSALLDGICFLQRAAENTIRRLEPVECLPLLFQQVYMPKDPTAVALTLELIDVLVKNVPLYLLKCNMSEAAVKCSFEEMIGINYPTT